MKSITNSLSEKYFLIKAFPIQSFIIISIKGKTAFKPIKVENRN